MFGKKAFFRMEPCSTEFRFGIDIEVRSDDEEVSSHNLRVMRIENLAKCHGLKKLAIVASCVNTIQGLDENRELVHLEIYQGMLRKIENISHLHNLEILDLSFNQIRRIEGLESLTNLRKLYLSSNKISKIEGLENLTNLTVLELGANRIRTIEGIETLTRLEQLWLGKNKIDTMDGFAGCWFPKLTQLSLQSNRLTSWSVDLFARAAPNLTNIYLGSNQLLDPDFAVLSAMNDELLEEIDLSCNKLTAVPAFTRPMVNLEELWLNDNAISDTSSFSRLAAAPRLRTIYMERNPVQKECPLDYRKSIIKASPDSLEQIDACIIPKCETNVVSSCPSTVKSILKHS